MGAPRYLCSQLVRLAVSAGNAEWVNLEEIWDDGAMLDCENEVELGLSAIISADDAEFSGGITAVEQYEFGWRVEMTFSPATRWTIEKWRPEHAVDADRLK